MPPLYGPQQSRFARYLERREQRRPDQEARELRRRVLVDLRGSVLEVGCGDGRSFEHYPSDVERLLAVEPDATARAAAAERARNAAVPIEVVGGTAEKLPAADGEFDAAVSDGDSLQRPRSRRRARRIAARPEDPVASSASGSMFVPGTPCSARYSAPPTSSSGRGRSAAARRRGIPQRRSERRDSSSSDSSEASTRRLSSRSHRRRTSSAPPPLIGLEELVVADEDRGDGLVVEHARDRVCQQPGHRQHLEPR